MKSFIAAALLLAPVAALANEPAPAAEKPVAEKAKKAEKKTETKSETKTTETAPAAQPAGGTAATPKK